MAGAGMSGQPPALRTQLSSQDWMSNSAATQHSGQMFPALYFIMMVRYLLMVNDVLPTNNTATTPGTPRTLKTLKTEKLIIHQLVKINLTKYFP